MDVRDLINLWDDGGGRSDRKQSYVLATQPIGKFWSISSVNKIKYLGDFFFQFPHKNK